MLFAVLHPKHSGDECGVLLRGGGGGGSECGGILNLDEPTASGVIG